MRAMTIYTATLVFLITSDGFGGVPFAGPGGERQPVSAGSDSTTMESPSSDPIRFDISGQPEAARAGGGLSDVSPATPVETPELPAPRIITPEPSAPLPMVTESAPIVIPVAPSKAPEMPAPRLAAPASSTAQPARAEPAPAVIPVAPQKAPDMPMPRLITPQPSAPPAVVSGAAPAVIPFEPATAPAVPAPRLVVPEPAAPEPVVVEPAPAVIPPTLELPAAEPVAAAPASIMVPATEPAAATVIDEPSEPVPEPTTTDEEMQQRIQDLLDEAEIAYREKRLTTPKGRAAADYYRQVMALDRDNEAAHQGLKKISASYVRWGLTEVSRGRLARARMFRDRGESVLPGSTARLGEAINRSAARAGRSPPRRSSTRQPTLLEALDDMIHLRTPKTTSGGAEILEQD